MSRDAGDILKEALGLPPEARAALADSLWNSLEEQPDENVEIAWQNEVKKRLAELDSGAVTTISWSEARAHLFAKLRK